MNLPSVKIHENNLTKTNVSALSAEEAPYIISDALAPNQRDLVTDNLVALARKIEHCINQSKQCFIELLMPEHPIVSLHEHPLYVLREQFTAKATVEALQSVDPTKVLLYIQELPKAYA